MAYTGDRLVHNITASRSRLPHGSLPAKKSAEEGGCGVTGFIASVPVSGRHIFAPSIQMHNRGNGKGGGIAAVGLCPDDLGVSREVLDSHYLLQVALLDPEARAVLEKEFIEPNLDVYSAGMIPTLDDYRSVEGLEVRPPDVVRYFVRVKPGVLDRFISDNGLDGLDPLKAEDEYISQNSFKINQSLYASHGRQKAFVLSHGRNIMILKIVGYAEKVVRYYMLDEFRAHGWIAHQRYPTKGRVWHPGGAHPFSGMHEALVHNGDFANYHAVCEYLRQYNIFPLFLTDTEVSVHLFDLLSRTFGYPMEYIIEAMAPTSEHDFDLLPADRQALYRRIQSTHIHGSPDGPWFFIIARNNSADRSFQLIGITDTAMLRPQVFALQEGEVQIGLICSEKQAIDATLQSLASEDSRFCPVADRYWNARGGSAADGGAFIFTVSCDGKNGEAGRLTCTSKFGDPVTTHPGQTHCPQSSDIATPPDAAGLSDTIACALSSGDVSGLAADCLRNLAAWDFDTLRWFCSEVAGHASQCDTNRTCAIELLTRISDLGLATGTKKRSSVLQIVGSSLERIFDSVPGLAVNSGSKYRRIDRATRTALRAPKKSHKILVLDARDFPPEGDGCDARLICTAHELGWKRFICYGYRGQRFCGCGLSRESDGVRIDVYGSSGDYLASGIDGLEMYVHGSAQDQLGQIMKRGRLVVYGDVGQTFMYGAKGGDVYVLGSAAGRPLINAVGRPRVIINGTCLDYLAESFMAGDPLNGGGFVVLNGLAFDSTGAIEEMAVPYPGSNLFSLASGGAIYIRDPHRTVVADQLNGGEFADMTPADWKLILPYLQENENLFGISVEDTLLRVGGVKKSFRDVYRKVQAVQLEVLSGEVDTAED